MILPDSDAVPLAELVGVGRYRGDLARSPGRRYAETFKVTEEMDKIFSWKQTDSVDVELLDRQHQALFQTAQELFDALKRADGLAVAEDVFSRLIDYSSNHFAAEESLMEKQNYPRLKTHRAEHREFTIQLLAFQKDFRAGSRSVMAELLPYLQQWIKNHVQGADHQYGEFLKVRGDGRADAAR